TGAAPDVARAVLAVLGVPELKAEVIMYGAMIPALQARISQLLVFILSLVDVNLLFILSPTFAVQRRLRFQLGTLTTY
ncbi:hypothetical protein N9M98_05685, partial [Candidatus Pseudothioglobus singularis]|nr:hypothetical protein [Candidatus Pseudothioglobus singularis]